MTGDARRDDHATEHPFGVPDSDMEPNEYVDHQQREAEADRQTCGRPLTHWENPHVSTPCGRPLLHDGDCHPVPLAQDKEGSDG